MVPVEALPLPVIIVGKLHDDERSNTKTTITNAVAGHPTTRYYWPKLHLGGKLKYQEKACRLEIMHGLNLGLGHMALSLTTSTGCLLRWTWRRWRATTIRIFCRNLTWSDANDPDRRGGAGASMVCLEASLIRKTVLYSLKLPSQTCMVDVDGEECQVYLWPSWLQSLRKTTSCPWTAWRCWTVPSVWSSLSLSDLPGQDILLRRISKKHSESELLEFLITSPPSPLYLFKIMCFTIDNILLKQYLDKLDPRLHNF